MSLADVADLVDSEHGWPLCPSCSDPLDPDDPHTDCEVPVPVYLLDVVCHDPASLLPDDEIVRRFQVVAGGDVAAIAKAEEQARDAGLEPVEVHGVGHAMPGSEIGAFVYCAFCDHMIERRGRTWTHVGGVYGCRAIDVIRAGKAAS